jgi:hypothetical protein
MGREKWQQVAASGSTIVGVEKRESVVITVLRREK